MPKKYKNDKNKLLNELIKRLNHLQSIDELTKEDAINILIGAIVLNYKFLEKTFEKEGVKAPTYMVKKILQKRIEEIFKEIV